MKALKSLAILACTYLFFACSPADKEAYLTEYASFMTEIETNHKSYEREDWVAKSEDFKKYSQTYFEQFSDEMSKEEKTQVLMYKTKYMALAARSNIKSLWNDLEDIIGQ